jgi:peptide deformylase
MSVAEITLGALITGVFGRYSQLIIKAYIDRNIMAILDILYYPDKRLRTVAKPVEKVDDSIKKLVDDMFETMYLAPGIGLAATQVDVHQQVIVIDTSEDKSQPLCLINPEIIAEEGTESCDEGCLSVPDIYETVERSENVTVKALNENGDEYTLEAGELLAVCIQHEIDHLKGKLFVDYLSPLKQQRLKKRLLKSQREISQQAVL